MLTNAPSSNAERYYGSWCSINLTRWNMMVIGLLSRLYWTDQQTTSFESRTLCLVVIFWMHFSLWMTPNHVLIMNWVGSIRIFTWCYRSHEWFQCEDDNNHASKVVLSEEDACYEKNQAVDSKQFDVMSPGSIKKKVNSLFKVGKLKVNSEEYEH